MKHNTNKSFFPSTLCVRNRLMNALLLLCIISFQITCIGNDDDTKTDKKFIEQYIQSKGIGIISFDSSNIKQFWIDNSVIGRNDCIEIILKGFQAQLYESIPLFIQLANVDEMQDCKIEVISDNNDFSFRVLNNKSKVVSETVSNEKFLNYNVLSSIFHLEDTPNSSFYLQFNSKSQRNLSIIKIVFSFSKNPSTSFLRSPGILHIKADDVNVSFGEKKTLESENVFSITGKSTYVYAKNKIYVTNNTVSNHITIKNTGEVPVRLNFGYAQYTTNFDNIRNINNAYKGVNQVLQVISSNADSNKIIVGGYPEWEKGCYLVTNAKEDFSDFPNFSFLDGTIDDVKKIDDAQSEITLNNPLKIALKKGTLLRVQAKPADPILYTNIKDLNPGEEVTLSSELHKDDDFLMFSPKAFCRGTYYIVPYLLTNSLDKNKDATILISDYSVSY